MRTWHLLTTFATLLLIMVAASATAGGAYASGPLQEEEGRVGLFGTVTALVDGTIILDSGEIVATDENTRFLVPDVDATSLADIAVGDRLAIIAVELDDGSLLAVYVLVTSEEAISNVHFVGLVTGVAEGVVTLTDDEGNAVSVELPEGAAAEVGDFLTLISSPDTDRQGPKKANAISKIEDIIDRLEENIQQATEEAIERLEALLEDNGDEHLTALANALERASEEARDALENALEATQSHLEDVYERVGVEGPFVRVKGFITALSIDADIGTVTIDDTDDGEVALSIVEATEIGDSIGVGDFVKAKYNLDLLAKEIELEDDELTFRGTIASFSESELVFEDGASFDIDGDTDIEGILAVGAEAKVEAQPQEGRFVAIEIKVEGVEEEEEEGVEGPGEIDLKGIITALSDTEIEVDGLPVLITPDTEIDGTLALGAFIKVEGTIEDGTIVASKIEVKGERDRGGRRGRDGDGSDIEFEGTIVSFSETRIELEDRTIILIDGDTEIEGTFFIGAEVEVKARISAEGDIVGTDIEVEEPDEDEAGRGQGQQGRGNDEDEAGRGQGQQGRGNDEDEADEDEADEDEADEDEADEDEADEDEADEDEADEDEADEDEADEDEADEDEADEDEADEDEADEDEADEDEADEDEADEDEQD